jgi:hypothetical protein
VLDEHRLDVRVLAEGAPYVFVAGLLIAIATGLQLLLPCLDPHAAGCAACRAEVEAWRGLSSAASELGPSSARPSSDEPSVDPAEL